MKRTIALGGLALAFLGMGCAKTPQPTATATEQPTPSNDAESVNSVEGSFTVVGFFAKDKPPEAVTLTQAYARRVMNKEDQSKQDILILLTEKALARKVLAEAGDEKEFASSSRQSKLENRGVRGIQLRFPAERKSSSEGNQEAESVAEEDFASVVYFNGAIPTNVLEFKRAVFTPDAVQGTITARGDWAGKFNVSFKVSLRPQGWTGGTFYVQPPTNLEPGRASGQIVVDGKATKLNYVYARQERHDMFDEKESRVKVIFTEKPVAENALGEDIEHLLRMKEAGNNYVMLYQLTAKEQSGYPEIWAVGQLSSTQTAITLGNRRDLTDTVTNTDIDLSKFDDRTIDGRIYSTGPNTKFDHTYELDVLFNVQINKPDGADSPVTVSNGQPLPSDGGAPGQAYLAFTKAVEATKNLTELKQVLETSLSATPLAEARKSLAELPSAKEQATFELFKLVVTIKDLRIEGGFVSGDKATLTATGTDGGEKANARINMHLENGQWKVGTSSTRVGDMK